MTAPAVDVLAVLAFAVGKDGSKPPPSPTHFDDALAAVAELVEVASKILASNDAALLALRELGIRASATSHELNENLRAALSKFGGAA